MKKLALVLLLVAGLASSASAGPVVTVAFTGVSPAGAVTVDLPPGLPLNWEGIAAGVMNLTVNGDPYKGFCIDLYHAADTDPLPYTIDPLESSPTAIPPGAMGIDRANFIREMWAYGYANALLTGNAARAFQVALWGILEGSVVAGVAAPSWSFLSTTGPSAQAKTDALVLITWANANTGALADVAGLNNVDGEAQAYAIPYTFPVPDGGTTVMLLGGALIGLGALRRKFRR